MTRPYSVAFKQKMAPEVEVHDGKRRSIAERYESTRGANLEVNFVANAAEDHYVTVRNWSAGSGSYVLNVEPSKYYDEFEPNDAASEASLLTLGRVVEATILDGKDIDWYRFNAPGLGSRKITLTNIKGKLRPEITLFNSNKSEFLNRYDSTEGANLAFTTKIPSEEFYITVEPWSGGWGRYSLVVH